MADYFDPSNPDQYGNLDQYNTNNPMMQVLQKLLQVLGNFSQTPRATGGEDVYGAALRREYERNLVMEVQRNSAVTNGLTNFFGVNPHSPVVQMAGLLSGDPNGGYGAALKMLTGSNPMAASSQLYSGLNGATMGSFGRFGHIGVNEILQANNDLLNSQFFKSRQVDPGWQAVQTFKIQQQADAFRTANPHMAALYGKDNNLNLSDTDFNQIQQTRNELKSSDGSKEAMQTIMDKFAKNVSSNLKQVADDYANSNHGVMDSSTFERMRNTLFNGPLANTNARISDIKNIKNIFGGVDYSISRGYGLEELAPQFVRGAQLGLIGKHSNLSDSYVSGIRGGNIEKALSAFRPIGAAMGTSEIEAINQLFANEAPDITLHPGANKVAQLGRDVAAVSRVAGMSIKSLIGMVKTMQDLSAQNPELQYMGSSTTQLTLDAVKKATALNMVLSADQSRALGGVQGIANRELSTTFNSLTSPMGKLIGNSLLLAKQASLQTGHTIDISDLVQQYSNSRQTDADLSNFINGSNGKPGVAGRLGINPQMYMQTVNNEGLTSDYTSNPDLVMQSAAFSKNAIRTQVDNILRYSGLSYKDVSNAYNKYGPNGWRSALALSGGRTAGAGLQALARFAKPGSNENDILLQVLGEDSPDFAKAKSGVYNFAAQTSFDEEQFELSNSQNYGTALSNIANQVFSGQVTDPGSLLAAVRNSFISPTIRGKSGQLNSQHFEAWSQFIMAGAGSASGPTAKDAAAMLNGLGVGGGKLSEATITKLQGLLSSGNPRNILINRINNSGDKDLIGLLQSNPDMFSDNAINAFEAIGKSILLDDQNKSQAGFLLSGDMSQIQSIAKGINNPALQAALSKANASDILKAGGLSQYFKSLNIKGLSDQSINYLSDSIGGDQFFQKMTMDSQGGMNNSSSSDSPTDPMNIILQIIQTFMGKDGSGGSFGSSLTSVTNALLALK